MRRNCLLEGNSGNARGRGVARTAKAQDSGQVLRRNCKANCRHITVEGQLVRLAEYVNVDAVLTGLAVVVLWAATSGSLSAPTHPYIVYGM